jgi:hypothetical protein
MNLLSEKVYVSGLTALWPKITRIPNLPHPGWLAYLNEFIEEAKTSGLVQRAIERAGQGGVQASRLNSPRR